MHLHGGYVPTARCQSVAWWLGALALEHSLGLEISGMEISAAYSDVYHLGFSLDCMLRQVHSISPQSQCCKVLNALNQEFGEIDKGLSAMKISG